MTKCVTYTANTMRKNYKQIEGELNATSYASSSVLLLLALTKLSSLIPSLHLNGHDVCYYFVFCTSERKHCDLYRFPNFQKFWQFDDSQSNRRSRFAELSDLFLPV